jgi:hypothetical protein
MKIPYMIILSLYLVLARLVFGCDESDKKSVDPDKLLSDLTEEEIDSVCADIGKIMADAECSITQEDDCRFDAYSIGAFADFDSSICEDALEDCMAEPDDDFADPAACVSDTKSLYYDECMQDSNDWNNDSATVGDLKACWQAVAAAELFQYDDEFVSCDNLSEGQAAEFDQNLQELVDEKNSTCGAL